MKKILAAAFLSALIYAPVAQGQNDIAGSKDYPGIARMPNHFIYLYSESPYDGFAFSVMKDGKRTNERVEGKYVMIQYVTRNNISKPSALQYARNYQNAVKAAGGGRSSTILRAAVGTTPRCA